MIWEQHYRGYFPDELQNRLGLLKTERKNVGEHHAKTVREAGAVQLSIQSCRKS